MTTPLIILDRQHAGKPGNRGDRGATTDLDGNGRVDQWEREALLTPRYLLVAEEILLAAGLDVICLSDGSYAERHARAKAYKADIYVAAHLNAGGGLDGKGFWDSRSRKGAALAVAVATNLRAICPELRKAEPVACRDDRHDSTTPWLWRPWYTIEGVFAGSPVGLCYEPCFLDQPAHRPLLDDQGLGRLGLALAEGILAYLGHGG